MIKPPGLKTLPKLGLFVLVGVCVPRALVILSDILSPLVPALLVVLVLGGVWWVGSRLRQR